jgi:hypothetical protein
MENNDLEIIDVQSVSVTEAQSRAEIDIQISTAKRYPRNAERATQNVIAVLARDKEFAKQCVYSLPRAGKEISGPSVHLARFLASEYGNLRVDAKIVEVGDTMITAQAVAFDLERNYAIRTEVKRRITDKHGQRFADDMVIVTCNAGLAIALRNAIMQVIPATVTTRVYESAQKAIVGNMTTEEAMLKRRKEILDGFLNTYNVTETEILALLELETANQIREPQMLTLIGLAQALKDGDTTVAEAFGRNVQSSIQKNTRDKVKQAIDKANERRKKPGTKTEPKPETKPDAPDMKLENPA